MSVSADYEASCRDDVAQLKEKIPELVSLPDWAVAALHEAYSEDHCAGWTGVWIDDWRKWFDYYKEHWIR